ncbi:MAG TPA: hypothetical protein VHB68_19190 [Steroidobacteraceae bacterium]|nr:hypothetical protein [Steroidobacteraceae bacterium]
MRREIIWILMCKLAALLLLWALFFSPAQRTVVDGASLGRQLAVAPAEPAAPASATSSSPFRESHGE